VWIDGMVGSILINLSLLRYWLINPGTLIFSPSPFPVLQFADLLFLESPLPLAIDMPIFWPSGPAGYINEIKQFNLVRGAAGMRKKATETSVAKHFLFFH
jgi:hypothetical protein